MDRKLIIFLLLSGVAVVLLEVLKSKAVNAIREVVKV
jgi:hypothetical protein